MSLDVKHLAERLLVAVLRAEPEAEALARAAYRHFGRGSGHPAALNYGDRFAYALAKDGGEPLLFEGHDFGPTDVVAAAR